MAQSGGSSIPFRAASKPASGRRRFWTPKEEEALILSVKELIAEGMKAGNGWRGGFYKQVGEKLQKFLPGTKLRGDPHALSRMTQWKKEYYLISEYLGASGRGVDPSTYMLIIEDEEIWQYYCQRNSDLEKCRGRPFPYYEHWCEMFGKDRATGAAAHDIGSTILNLLNNPAPSMENMPSLEREIPIPIDVEVDDVSVTMPRPESDPENMRQKKRKSAASLGDEPFFEMMGSFMKESKEIMLEMSKAITSLKGDIPSLMDVYGALEKVPNLSDNDRIRAASKLVNNPSDVALFFSLNDALKSSFVKMKLDCSL